MKGGKAGRKRTTGGQSAGRPGKSGRGPKKGSQRLAGGAPKKGAAKKPHIGARSTSGEE